MEERFVLQQRAVGTRSSIPEAAQCYFGSPKKPLQPVVVDYSGMHENHSTSPAIDIPPSIHTAR
jgi:hypothetical protein